MALMRFDAVRMGVNVIAGIWGIGWSGFEVLAGVQESSFAGLVILVIALH
jgi:hypothetical protein